MNSESVHEATRRLLIVDDHPVLRLGLTALIESEPGFVVCGEADNGIDALDMVSAKMPDLVIVDLVLDGSDGLDLIKSMKSKHPKIPTLVLSMHEEEVYAERSLRAGASGYVTKQQLDVTLLTAISCVLGGDIYMSDTLKARLAKKFVSGKTLDTDSPLALLSDRELQVFGLIGRGVPTRDIARRLNLSIKTIESHIEHIKQKMSLDCAATLAQRATQWVETGQIG